MTSRRGINSTHVVLLIALALLVVVVGEYVSKETKPGPKPLHRKWDVDFKVGGTAPDFELPDASGKPRRLSELVTGKTVIVFVDNGKNSVELLRYLEVLRKIRGKIAPEFISIATFDPSEEASFREKTGLPQTVLYEKKGGAVATQWKADPAPRVFYVRDGLKVGSTGLSPAEAAIFNIGVTAADAMGFGSPFADGKIEPINRAPEPKHLDKTDPVLDAAPPQPAQSH